MKLWRECLCIITFVARLYGSPVPEKQKQRIVLDFVCHSECEGIVGKNEDDSLRKRFACSSVFEDEYIKWSQEKIRDPGIFGALHTVNVTESKVSTARSKRSALPRLQCPQVNEEYYSRDLPTRRRSISPWMEYVEHDDNRRPRRIIVSKCLCDGCMNLTTGREDLNLFSIPIMYDVPVWTKKLGRTTKRIESGCTCGIPQLRSNND